MRGFIDDVDFFPAFLGVGLKSQSAFVRGFIDDRERRKSAALVELSQSAFVRGFIDDKPTTAFGSSRAWSLNPRSCAASSMTTRIATN